MSLMTQVGLEFIARDRSQAGVNSFNRNISVTSRSVMRLGSNMLALAGAGGGFYMLGNVLRESRQEFGGFEMGLAKISTQLDAATMHYLPTYRKELLRMSAAYGESKTALTDAMFDILSATIAPADAMKFLDVSVRSAKGGFTDAAVTTKASARIMMAYGMAASDVTRINDIMHGSVKQGIMTFNDFADSIGKILGLASFLKVDFEAVGASIAAMTRSGLTADEAVTALKNVFNQFKYPTQAARDVARELGYELDETSIQGRGLITIMEKLSKAQARHLEVLMPSMRGVAGFAGMLKNAGGLARDYSLNLDSAGRMQTNFAKAAATDSYSIEQSTQRWSNFKIMLGEVTSPIQTAAMKSLTETMEENRSGIIRWANNVVEGAGMVKKVMPIFMAYNALRMAPKPSEKKSPDMASSLGLDFSEYEGFGLNGYKAERLPPGHLNIPADRAEYMRKMVERAKELSFVGPPEPATPQVADAAVSARTNAQIVADTREKLASIRSMDDLTRQGKIQNLKVYMAEHADTLSGVTEAEQLLTNEMAAIIASRGNAMKNYNAELLEDMENLALYTSEKFAEASRSIESGLSSAFLSLRKKGSNLGSFMVNVFTSIQDSFARMLADMAARAIQNAAINPLMSGLSGVLGSLFGPGAAVGAGGQPFTSTNPYGLTQNPVPTRHSGWVPDGVPSFHGGRGLDSNEQVAVIRDDELIAPAGQIVRSPFSRGGSSAPNINIYNESGQQIEQKGPPEFDGERWVIGLVAKNISEGGSLSKMIGRR